MDGFLFTSKANLEASMHASKHAKKHAAMVSGSACASGCAQFRGPLCAGSMAILLHIGWLWQDVLRSASDATGVLWLCMAGESGCGLAACWTSLSLLACAHQL